jgi:hypothetical protein
MLVGLLHAGRVCAWQPAVIKFSPPLLSCRTHLRRDSVNSVRHNAYTVAVSNLSMCYQGNNLLTAPSLACVVFLLYESTLWLARSLSRTSSYTRAPQTS